MAERKERINNDTPSPLSVKITLGVFLFLAGVMFIYLSITLWPTLESGTSEQSRNWSCSTKLLFGLLKISLKGEACLILLVILASFLGSFVHIASSFVYHVGNDIFTSRWIFWYLLRMFIGTALALIFYFVLRGGLLTTNSASEFVNPFGIAGVSGLVGLFSKQATEKLKEVFDTMFQVQTSDDNG